MSHSARAGNTRPRHWQGAARRLSRRLAAAAIAATIVPGAAAVAQALESGTADVDHRLDALLGSHAPYRAFFEALQKAVAADDRKAVADRVDYPFRTRIEGKAVTVHNAASFVQHYERIVAAKVKRAITEQSYAKLFANWQGVMVGDGELWFAGVGKSGVVRITAINPRDVRCPRPGPSVRPCGSGHNFALCRRPRQRAPRPRRLWPCASSLHPGPRTTRAAGARRVQASIGTGAPGSAARCLPN